ncbi:hypothetical protein [Polyangium sorediatum]|uniref:Uncharacterized protein n=1 Tax=Polyangium sorediatum TaxID=889274 RepID=A0ABT6P277_9BACT|nr:hypothetical protein [Polyangium sorediatum]MDI1434664.1 hypothetical protein [Polyangium sorediatum]
MPKITKPPVARATQRTSTAKGAAGVKSKNAAPKTPFTTDDAAAAYTHFLSLAEALPAEDVLMRSGDVSIALTNVRRGVDAIRPHVAQIPKLLPKVAVHELLELPALALALLHADGRITKATSTREIDAALSRVGPLRDLTLTYLEIVAELGLIAKDRVRAIRTGKGKLDNARDCIDIAGLFREVAPTLAGKHPFSDEQLDELAKTGTWLVQTLKPASTTRAKRTRPAAAMVRDRFWKLVEDRHDQLRTVGVALFGIRNVDEHVPPLLSRVSTPKAAGEHERGASSETTEA